MDVQYQVAGFNIGMPVVRKVGRSVYGHVIAKFSTMDRLSKIWGSAQNIELGPWLKKYQRETLQKYATSMGRKMSPRCSQVMMASGCSSLKAVN